MHRSCPENLPTAVRFGGSSPRRRFFTEQSTRVVKEQLSDYQSNQESHLLKEARSQRYSHEENTRDAMCARENDTITTLAHLFVVWSGRPRTRRAPLEPRIIRVPRNKRRLRLALKFASARFICCSNIAVHRAALCADIQFIRNRGREPEARLSPHCGHSV